MSEFPFKDEDFIQNNDSSKNKLYNIFGNFINKNN
jgi:hypothetical protein